MSAEPAPDRLLFACTSNALRSPMAAGLMRRRFGPLVHVASAGVRPAPYVDAMAAAVMDELGVEMFEHEPKGFEALEDFAFDLIISLSPEAHHHALERAAAVGARAEYWPTPDPSVLEGSREQRLSEYRALRERLDAQIGARFERPSTG